MYIFVRNTARSRDVRKSSTVDSECKSFVRIPSSSECAQVGDNLWYLILTYIVMDSIDRLITFITTSVVQALRILSASMVIDRFV
jgi:hypothetical protein